MATLHRKKKDFLLYYLARHHPYALTALALMRSPSRQINIFSVSALDLFASAMGAFVIIAVILFPYYMKADALQPKDIEVVFVCDTTGSMQNHIDGIKSNLKDVIDILKLVNKRTRVGFVAYKDITEQGHPGTYVTKTFPLTDMNSRDFGRLNRFVDSLTAYVVANRDLPESMSVGLEEALRMSWTGGKTKRIIVVITDASAKEPGKTLSLAKKFNRSSRSSKITAILARTENMDPEAVRFLTKLAQVGGGDYIQDSGRMLNSLIRATLSD